VGDRSAGSPELRDPLTGLLTRNGLVSFMAGSPRASDAVVLYLDLDNFRRINDGFDRIAGDRVLVTMARRLEESIGAGGMIARISGDEFAVVMPSGGMAAARSLAEHLTEKLAEPVEFESGAISLTVSIGVAPIKPGESIEDALLRADVAMAYAKDDEVGGQIRPYRPEMSAAANQRVAMEAELRLALARGQFRLFYQPLVDLTTYVTYEVEALLRWQHPRRGLLSPSEFLPVADDLGLMGEIGRWVLREACWQGRAWQERFAGGRQVVVAVNVAPGQLRDPHFGQEIIEVLEETGFDPALLRLEISETVGQEDIEPAIRLMRQLHPLGVRLSLDDFGAGYSGWSFLQQCPVDAIKIDRSVLEAGSEAARSRPGMVEAMVAFAERLGMPVTIEGVERVEQVSAMRSLGISTAQGFFFARPLPADIVSPLLANGPLA
jgi:diguanylate cyclase (GGDEF)-like protein